MHRRGSYVAILLALTSATMLGGCTKQASRMDPGGNISTASTAPASVEAISELGRAWEADPADVSKGLAYANALESIGKTDQQLSVYAQLAQRNRGNGKLASLYGRKLVAAGRSAEAIPVLEVAVSSSDADWRVHSALGTAYDQQGLYEKARPHYEKALAADPRNLSVMNNLGMSYALQGNLTQAEATLRQADALPRSRSEPRIRQNLALVVGL